MKTKGRPKGPEKVVFKRRVTPEQKRRIDELLEVIRRGRSFDGAVASRELVKITESLSAREPDKSVSEGQKLCMTRMVHGNPYDDKGVSAIPVTDEALRKQNDELAKNQLVLLDDIQRLTDQVASLEMELEECRLLTYDEKMAYWKARALKAEAYGKSKDESQ